MGSVNSVIGIWKITHPIISFKKVQKIAQKIPRKTSFSTELNNRKIKNYIFFVQKQNLTS